MSATARPAAAEPLFAALATADAPLVLALDLGTSSVRAAAFDRRGRSVGSAQIRYEWSTTPDGGVETDPERLVACAAAAIDGVLAILGPDAAEVAAVGVAAFWHGLVGLDENGLAATPAFAWNDVRATGAAAELRRRLDEAAVHARTGVRFHPSYLPARLLWLRGHRPGLYERVRRWASPAEHLLARFFGEARSSLSMASGTGLLDQRTDRWDEELLDLLGLDRSSFPPLVDLDAAFRGLRPEFAERWPALGDVPWLPAVGDGAAANVGSGCTGPAEVALSIGTSGALRLLVDAAAAPRVAPGLWRYRLDRRRALVGGAISNGGIVYRRLRELLRLPPPDELEARLRASPPDAHGLTVLPFLAGERSPDWPLDARSAILGLSLDTSPVQLLQAGLEAVAYRLALVFALLREHLPDAPVVVGSGGALSGSPAWAAILADVLGRPLVASRVAEASSRGAALLALESLGLLRAEAAPRPWGEAIEPDPARHERYRAAIERHRALDARLRGFATEG